MDRGTRDNLRGFEGGYEGRKYSKRACVSDVVEKGIGALTVQDSGVDTSLGASERQPKAPLSASLEASQASENNDVDILDFDETPGLFEDFVKVDSSVHDFEIESEKSALLRNVT